MKVSRLACTPQQDREVIEVGRIDGPESLFVEDSIYGHRLKMPVDTGGSIAQPEVVNVWRVKELEKKLFLTTATGLLGEETLKHHVVASIKFNLCVVETRREKTLRKYKKRRP